MVEDPVADTASPNFVMRRLHEQAQHRRHRAASTSTLRAWAPPSTVEATARARFKEWESALDEVLDAYFEEGDEEAEAGQAREA